MKSFKILSLLVLNFVFGALISTASGFNPVIGGSVLVGAQVVYAFVPQEGNLTMATVGFSLTEINATLGAYCRKHEKKIMQLLFQDIELEKHTRKVSGISDEYAVSSSSIDNVLQPYQKAWTPKGEVNFTAVINKVRQVKIDYELCDLDELYRSWLCFMADEKKHRKDWPFTRYILREHIIPQIRQEIDFNSYNGVWAAPIPGTPGASATSVTGFKKIIEDLITATTIVPIATGAITSSNIVDRVEFFVDSLPNRYSNISTPILMSKTLAKFYWRDYRQSFGGNNDYTGKGNLKVDATMKTIIGVDSMEGSDRFIHTTKGNMLTMFDKIDTINNLETQVDKRQINMLGDFKRGYGFGIAEEVFVNDQA